MNTNLIEMLVKLTIEATKDNPKIAACMTAATVLIGIGSAIWKWRNRKKNKPSIPAQS